MLRVLEPVSPPRQAKAVTKPLAPRVGDLNGKVLGFLSNMWPSVPYTFERFQALARERYKVPGVVYQERALTSAPAPAEMINELATKSDLVFVALGH